MDEPAIFTALSTSVRQLYLLLRCLSFASKAEVRILPEGLSFSVEDSRVVQGTTLLERKLFSSYKFHAPADGTVPTFQISLPALLETLQIFGSSDLASSHRHQNGGFSSSYTTAFHAPALALGGTCQISYPCRGAPLSITISEAGVTTTCDLSTYETPAYDEDLIPLDKSALVLKLVMRSTWLQDAIGELSGSNPTVLVLNASSTSAPYFALEGRGGPFGDSAVEFQPEDSGPTSIRGKRQPQITETFTVNALPGSHGRFRQTYKFDLIKKAGRAMALASKVSLRQDAQGVLGLQFMVEMDGDSTPRETNGAAPSDSVVGSAASFVQFRFVPLVEEDEEDGGDDAGDGASA